MHGAGALGVGLVIHRVEDIVAFAVDTVEAAELQALFGVPEVERGQILLLQLDRVALQHRLLLGVCQLTVGDFRGVLHHAWRIGLGGILPLNRLRYFDERLLKYTVALRQQLPFFEQLVSKKQGHSTQDQNDDNQHTQHFSHFKTSRLTGDTFTRMVKR